MSTKEPDAKSFMDEIVQLNKELDTCRYRMWCLYPSDYKYGDDGEMQASGIDFKRGDIESLWDLLTGAIHVERADQNHEIVECQNQQIMRLLLRVNQQLRSIDDLNKLNSSLRKDLAKWVKEVDRLTDENRNLWGKITGNT